MIWVTYIFLSEFLLAVLVLSGLALYAGRANRDAKADQALYPVAFVAGVTALFSAVGVILTGILAVLL
jgi:hypothetical protein